MFSDTKFWRLVWKEYRTQLPLWSTLLIATPLMQVGMLILRYVTDDFGIRAYTTETANGLMAIGFIASIVYLLGCCATMFSVEHETGVFDFQRVLPTNQPRVFWAKISFAVASSLLLTAILWLVTRGVFLWDAPQGSTWFGTYGLLYMAEIFAWSIFASLIVRQPLWGVIAAIAWQTLTMQLVLPYLTSGRLNDEVVLLLNEDLRFTLSRFVVLALLVTVDVVLGKLWYEDRLRLPRWRIGLTRDSVASYPIDMELPPYIGQRQIGWSRLLWLGWRDARWIVAGLFMWLAYCWRLSPNGNERLALMLTYFFGSFVCGLFAFVSEQWGDRYRYCTERGCSPRMVWLSRHVIWLSPVLLMSVCVFWLCSRNPQVFSSNRAQAQFEWAAVVWGPLVCYSAGQLAALLLRSTVVAIAAGLGLTFLGILWSWLMSSWLAPAWWSIGSLPVIGLFVTWLKANDWIEERRGRAARRRLWLGLGVPLVLLLTTCATYRVLQIPAVTLPAEWDEDSRVLARLTPAEKGTLDLYRRAIGEIERGEAQLETYAARSARLRQEHPDWTDHQVHAEAFKESHRDWLLQHVAVVPLLREAYGKPPVPLVLVEAELPPRLNDDWNPERTAKLPWLMILQAEHSLKNGDLDATWDDILIAFELLRRSDLRAAPVRDLFVNTSSASTHEAWLLATVGKWGRHKAQTRDRILKAIPKLEEIAADHTSIHRAVHHEYLHARECLKFGEAWKKYAVAVRSWGPNETFWKWSTVWNAMFWERWRSDRVVRWQSSLALQRADLLERILKANRPLPLFSQSTYQTDYLMAQAAGLVPPEERAKLLALGNYDLNSADSAIFQSTLAPPNMRGSVSAIVETEFLKRAESFRATILLLALSEYHREHGRYPESLSELAPTYFAEVPRNPKSTEPFVYFPHGVPEDVTTGSEERRDLRVIVRKETPFLVTTYGRGQPHAQQMSDRRWKFTDYAGKPMTLEAALEASYIWLIEPDAPKREP